MPSSISGSQISTANLLIGGTYLADTISTINNKVSNNYITSTFASNNYTTSTFASNNYIQANVGGTSANVIFVYDTVSGCAPTRAAGTQIMRIDFTLAKASYFEVHYQTIANYGARIDHYIWVDGVNQGSVLTSTNSNSWKPINLTFAGYLSAGSHYTYITSNQSNATGCGSSWGRGYVIIYE